MLPDFKKKNKKTQPLMYRKTENQYVKKVYNIPILIFVGTFGLNKIRNT